METLLYMIDEVENDKIIIERMKIWLEYVVGQTQSLISH